MTILEKSFLAVCMVLVFLAAYWTGEFTRSDLREGLLSTATFAFAFWMGRVSYARELKRAREWTISNFNIIKRVGEPDNNRPTHPRNHLSIWLAPMRWIHSFLNLTHASVIVAVFILSLAERFQVLRIVLALLRTVWDASTRLGASIGLLLVSLLVELVCHENLLCTLCLV
jgi:hypothetical protein